MLRSTTPTFQLVRKRDGRLIPFNQERITDAIARAMLASDEGDAGKSAQKVSDGVVRVLAKRFPDEAIPHIEEIQDVVEETLIAQGFAKTVKGYILYRNKRAEVREQQKFVPKHVRELAQESKKNFRNPLAEFIYYRTYSRWIETEGRRETWIETVNRFMDFMQENIGKKLSDEEYSELREAILRHEVMPSMRLMWSAGSAARKTNISGYNCSFISPTELGDFAEIMYILMCGTGVGFSVESHTAQQLPIVRRQTGRHLGLNVVKDSKEGWADALTFGMKTWYRGKDVDFDYSELRPAGARLMTMGGRSSGPDPLKALMEFARERILARQGKRLRNIDVHDIICKIGDVVVAGGVRRSALISLSDLDDEEMRDSKQGQFYTAEPQRSLANNSAVYHERPTAKEFLEEWQALVKSGTGERGIFNRGGLKQQMPDRRWRKMSKHLDTTGTNPCVTKDTLVYVADGRGHVPIGKLAREGKDVPVFCYDEYGRVTVRMMRHPRLTGKNKAVYRVTLDDGSSFTATGNHKVLMKSEGYREISDLNPGDSLNIVTKYAASIKDIFPEANSRSQDYWWVNSGLRSNKAEHRLIAEFKYGQRIPKGHIVHHRDRNAQNNAPENLEVMSKQDHDELHGQLLAGDNNPMRRAHTEWSDEKWEEYRKKHSENNRGEGNARFAGVTHEELKTHALLLTRTLGKRFSSKDWVEYAKERSLPQSFSKWRRDHLGGTVGLAKWAAHELGFEHVEADPRSVAAYRKYTEEGYDCEIRGGRVMIVKRCEACSSEFRTLPTKREHGLCSISCGLTKKWQDELHRQQVVLAINQAHDNRRAERRERQAEVYTDLQFRLGREPLKQEWIKACKNHGLSAEISRASSPFTSYKNLKEYAETYNHRVVSVEFVGREDVYNGTVDEYHNFFIGGFSSETKSGKRKLTYLNNLQCGEIVLRNKQFCNLSEVVARAEDTEETLLRKARLAAILGTYQSTLTNFPYISRDWKRNCEEERLLGVSITGQWDAPEARREEVLMKMRDLAVKTNVEYSKRFGVSPSTSVTCVKPSGTVSQLVDAASGMHPRHAEYYIRRVRIAATDPLFHMMKEQKFPYHPEVGQQEETASTFVLEFPVRAPKGAVLKNDLTAMDQLKHWKVVKENFTEHNPSVTVSIGEEEWIETAHWLYQNWDILGGLSFLPRTDYVYQLAPYEEITKEQYERAVANMPDIDFAQILLYEQEDNTEGAKELACVAGVCDVDVNEDDIMALAAAASGEESKAHKHAN